MDDVLSNFTLAIAFQPALPTATLGPGQYCLSYRPGNWQKNNTNTALTVTF